MIVRAADHQRRRGKPEGQQLGFAKLDAERLVLVAAPEIAGRAKARIVTADFLCGLPCIAYDETLPLVRPFSEHVFGKTPDMQAVATAPDLRILIGMAESGTGWTVLPDYLCAKALVAGRLVELRTDKPGPDNALYLAWNKSALRHPRVVHVRDFLLQSASAAD